MSAKRKPLPGHKFMGLRHAFRTDCECGWSSSTYWGQGAAGQVRAEWENHRRDHEIGKIILDKNGQRLRIADRVRVHTGEEGVVGQLLNDQTKSVNVLFGAGVGGMFFPFECERVERR